jgi:hypothetical protein
MSESSKLWLVFVIGFASLRGLCGATTRAPASTTEVFDLAS